VCVQRPGTALPAIKICRSDEGVYAKRLKLRRIAELVFDDAAAEDHWHVSGGSKAVLGLLLSYQSAGAQLNSNS